MQGPVHPRVGVGKLVRSYGNEYSTVELGSHANIHIESCGSEEMGKLLDGRVIK